MSRLTDSVTRQVLPFLLRVAAVGTLLIGIVEALEGRTYGHLTPIMWFVLALAALVAMVCVMLYNIEARLENLAGTREAAAATLAEQDARLAAQTGRHMFCPNCGQGMPRGAKFCEQCGVYIQDYMPK